MNPATGNASGAGCFEGFKNFRCLAVVFILTPCLESKHRFFLLRDLETHVIEILKTLAQKCIFLRPKNLIEAS